MLRPDLLKHFPPAFLGRLIVIPYYPISDAIMRQIIQLQLRRIQTRVQANHRAQLTYGDELVDAIKARCTEVDSGARNVEHILTRTLLPEISREVLSRMAADQRVHVGAHHDRRQRGLSIRRRLTATRSDADTGVAWRSRNFIGISRSDRRSARTCSC